MFAGFERRRVTLGEITINCMTGGDGPPVLLLHGFPQCLALWGKVAPLLAERFRVVCADLRGYGDSTKPVCAADASNYSFRAMAADQVALMRELGHDRFHVVGHDRGARTAHRMALDSSEAVRSLAVLDIVPTYAMFMETDRRISSAYWHWYFLSLPPPFPERLIGADPNFFYETSIAGWGGAHLDLFDPEMLAEYRRCWNDPAMIHGSCSDYRAALTVDLALDTADLARKVESPALAFWGSHGAMHKLFDMEAEWRKKCTRLQTATLPAGHFFIDQYPAETAAILAEFLAGS
jgi:haloacetate dehalogenase